MEKSRTLVDTCFLMKISNNGKDIDTLKKVIDSANIAPAVHPYVAEHELKLTSAFNKLIEEKYLTVISYEEIFSMPGAKFLYEGYIQTLYEDFSKMLMVSNERKAERLYPTLRNVDIYTQHKQGSSLGDAHMMLTATFLGIPVIYTEDSDIDVLKDIAARHIKFQGSSITIKCALDIVRELAAESSCILSKKELEKILDVMGERSFRSQIKKIWNETHEEC